MTLRTRPSPSRFASAILALALLVAATSSRAGAQQAAPAGALQNAALTDPMPVDPQILQGTLPNGLRYYVRQNQKPEKRAELRLVVKAGSILEENDQQGLAHFLEHMAFNGTAHFPKQELVSFLQSLGMRFGADINAYTSFDETVYMLQVPTDKPAVMDRALLILEDWAHNVTIDPAEVDKERGVIMEEWRLRRGAGARVSERMFPTLLKGSRYAERLPIGKTEIIQSTGAERLKQFYSDWYRPDLMAVVAVGDFDAPAIAASIVSRFGALPSAKGGRARTAYDLPDRPGTTYGVFTDKEMSTTSVEIDHLLPAHKQGTIGVYRQKIVDRLVSSMLSARLSELTQKPDAPFLSAFAGRNAFLVRSRDSVSLGALVKEDGIERGLDALFTEAQRAAKFGFMSTELDRVKQATMRNRERLLAEKDTRESFSRADEYVRNFLQGETLPTSDTEYALHARFVPGITLEEVNALARQWFTDSNRIVMVTAPEKAGLAVPDEAKLAAIASAPREVKPHVDAAVVGPLMEGTPAAGAIARATTREADGLTEWDLSNGVKVVLKPTAFKQDEILFRATSPGGTSLASDADYIPASTASQVVSAGGIGKLSILDMRRTLTGKLASVSAFIGELEEGLTGSSSPKDLETLFQLIHLRFTAPRADAAAVSNQAAQMKALLANQAASPEYAFATTVASILSGNHPRRQLPTAASVDQWNLDKSMAFYKDRFADASDFTFVFVGSFDTAAMKPLVERYLASLPSTRRKETWKDVGVRLPTGVIERKVEKGIEPKSQVAMVFSGPFEYTQSQRVAIVAMTEILQKRLLETIREELGGTYSINASQNNRRIPTPEYAVTIQFGCDPARAETLVGRVLQEIEQLKANGPTDAQVADEREALLRAFETNTKQNAYLLTQLVSKYQYGEDPATLWQVPDHYKKLDAAAIQQAARKYLNSANRVTVILYPEKRSQ